MFEKRIFLNAGHSIKDPGAVVNNKKESEEVMKIRDLLIPMLKRNDFEIHVVPDDLNLIQSISWVNKRVGSMNGGLAFSIHLNAGGGEGAESFYYKNNKDSKVIAKTLIDEYCRYTKLRNRGAKSDTRAYAKRLGWIRDTTPWSTLIECYFIDNKDTAITNKTIAEGIYYGICKVYNEEPVILEEKVDNKEDIKNQIINLLKQL